MARIVIDPVTRIEGHIRVEAELKDGALADAWISGTMFRGIELILKDRDPRDAWYFAQRICNVCSGVHAIASVRAVENALGMTIPENAQVIRNLVAGMHYIHDHVMHFYHLHALDWVDITSALKADPTKTSQLQESISDWPQSTPKYFGEMQRKLKAFVASGQLGIFANGYWGHPAYKLPPEANLMAVAHYLEALEWQKSVARFIAILGGRHPAPNFLVGGMATAINLDSDQALNSQKLYLMKELVTEALNFTTKVYLPDLLAIASFYRDWGALGGGVGNFLAYGDFPLNGTANDLFLPGGVIWNKKIDDVKPFDQKKVSEYLTHSWYDDAGNSKKASHPFDGVTAPRYTGPKPPYEHLDVDKQYSWIKAPRYEGKPVEVGPLARTLVAYGKGQPKFKKLVDTSLAKLGVGKEALFSTLGRTLARCVETVVIAEELPVWLGKLMQNIDKGNLQTVNSEKWDPSTWPPTAEGFGFVEAPRGALGHWVRIKDEKIQHYQAVVATTWNASPRDGKNQPGACEAALVGTPVKDPEQPLELLRTIHSFDPCTACAVHLFDSSGKEIASTKAQ